MCSKKPYIIAYELFYKWNHLSLKEYFMYNFSPMASHSATIVTNLPVRAGKKTASTKKKKRKTTSKKRTKR